MALFNQFCIKHKRWTHTIPCLWCDLERERNEFRKPYDLYDLPAAQRIAIENAVLRGDVARVQALLNACPFLSTRTYHAVLAAARQAQWALTSDEGEPPAAEVPNTFRLWPENWRQSVAMLLLAGVVFCTLYLFLRVFGCPPPPGMP